MLKLSRRTARALEAVLDIAYHGAAGPVQARAITERQGIPHRHLEQLLQRLVRGGVLRGMRGPRGGYSLARPRRDVTLGAVVRVVNVMDGDDGDGLAATELGREILAPVWDGVQGLIIERLDAVTLDELCRAAEARGILRTGDPAPAASP